MAHITQNVMLHGFLNIDKPAGISSHDVVARVRRVARQKRVGHAGTLDPAATGVLVVALGTATRLVEYVQENTSKRYLATVELGVSTNTDDAEGTIVDTLPVPELDLPRLERVLDAFRGPIAQIPPMFAALHHEGRRLHEIAREGRIVERAARPVVIERITLLEWHSPHLTLDILCSKGTYIRSLARDIGAALECGAHLHALRRTAVGHFTGELATQLATLEADSSLIMSIIIPPEQAVIDWPAIYIDHDQAQRIRNGMPVALTTIDGERARAHGPDGALLALLRRTGDRWQPDKVFDWT